MNKEIAKLGLILLIICGISTALLAALNGVTEPIIKSNSEKIQEGYRSEVLPSAEVFEKINEGVYIAKKGDTTVGYTINAAENGYGGPVSIMVGINGDFTVSGVKILDQSETAGLGAKCTDPEFLKQFEGKKSGMQIVKTTAGDTEIQAISGATRTTRAVVGGVEDALKKAKEAAK